MEQMSLFDTNMSQPLAARLRPQSLAEFAEMNYVRDNEIMYEIVTEHAASGEMPEWFYAGDLLIERDYKILGIEKFRTILNYYRKDVKIAEKSLY